MIYRSSNVNLTGVLMMGFLGCSGKRPEPVPIAADLPVWEVGATPTLSIGVVDGPPEYQFFRAKAAFRLGDGIVVANTGTRELRFFDSAGRFQTKAGGYGEGPGEFRSLDAAYPIGTDSVMAFHDAYSRSFFSGTGDYLGGQGLGSGWPNTRFPLEWWLYRRTMVVGVPEGPERKIAARVLDRLPPPPANPGYWFVRRDKAGLLWVSNGPDRDGGRSSWSVFDTIGVPVASVQLPARFEAFEIRETEILGRWFDEVDVEHIRVYPLERAPRDQWPVGPLPDTQLVAQDMEKFDARYNEIRSWLRNAITAQERFFADHRRYTTNRFELKLKLPEGVVFDLIAVGATGWMGVVAFAELPVICGIGLGQATPPGWSEGAPVCAEWDIE